MSDWREFEISNFEGIATSNRTPRKTQCQECKNFDLRNVLGDLQLREGFFQKSDIPLAPDYRSKLSNITFLGFENLYISETTAKQDIIIWVAKGTLAGETSSGDYPAPSNKNIVLLFSSHQFDGTNWVTKNWDGSTTGKYWLNHTIVTKISNGGVANNAITLDCSSTGLVNQLNGWTVVNISKNPYQVHQVIYSDANGSRLRVNITAYTHDWASGDELVFMRHYIPYEYLTGMYNSTSNQLSTHKVLDDVVIALGGEKNKIGLLIGYKKNYLKLAEIRHNDSIVFNAYYSSYSTLNNIICEPYIPIDYHNYGLDIFATLGTSGDELSAGKYFFRLTGLIDGYNEILLTEKSILLDNTYDLNVLPKIKMGVLNKRITSLRLYCATTANADDTIPTNPYFFVQEYELKTSDQYVADKWLINDRGELTLPTPDMLTEKYTIGNAASRSETNSTSGFFESMGAGTISVAGAGQDDSTPAADGFYWIKLQNTTGLPFYFNLMTAKVGLFKAGKIYNVSFYAKGDPITAGHTLTLDVDAPGSFPQTFSFTLSTEWQQFSFQVKPTMDSNVLLFDPHDTANYGTLANNAHIGIDGLSIMENLEGTANLTSISNNEMVDMLGYNATFDMIKSWDDAIVTRGRTFLVNPYIEKRYVNKIVSSHISGAGAYMYHIISAERYIDLENFDGNDLIGLEILPNMNFMAFRSNSNQQVDPETGATREIIYGNGVVARKSIVNFGDKIVWCGINDIMATDGLNTVSLTDGTIREDYRALTNKTGIVAVREERDNAYRFFTGDTTNRTEYILTKRGWIKRVNSGDIYPIHYAISRDSYVCFMDLTGMIYVDSGAITDTKFIPGEGIPGIILYPMAGTWQSIDFDIDLLGENLTETDFFTLRSMWLDYTGTYSEGTFTINIYIDGVSLPAITLYSKNQREKLVIPIPLANRKPARRFSIKITVGGAYLPGSAITIHSVGVLWKPIRSGRFN